MFIILVYLSKDEKFIASEIWVLLFSNSFETNWFYFITINLIYLFFVYNYVPSRKIVFTLIHILVNKLRIYNIIKIFLKGYYQLYYYYFKIKQPILLFIFSCFLITDSIYFNYYMYLEDFYVLNMDILNYSSFSSNDPNLHYFLKKSPRIRKLYQKLYRYNYYKLISLQINNKIYKISILDFLSLIQHVNFKINLKRYPDLKLIVKFIKTYRYLNDFFVNIISSESSSDYERYLFFKDWRVLKDLNSKAYKQILMRTVVNKFFKLDLWLAYKYPKKLIENLLKTFKFNPLLYMNFIIYILNQAFHLIKKKQNKLFIRLKIKEFNHINPHLIFTKLEFNKYFIYFNLFNYKDKYKQLFISNFFIEFKIMYQYIKLFIFFYLCSFFFLTSLLINILYIYIIFFIIKDLLNLVLHYHINKQVLLTKKIIRLIFYRISFFFFPPLNYSLFLILIIYFCLTILFIFIFSSYQFHLERKNLFLDDTFFNLLSSYYHLKIRKKLYNIYIYLENFKSMVKLALIKCYLFIGFKK